MKKSLTCKKFFAIFLVLSLVLTMCCSSFAFAQNNSNQNNVGPDTLKADTATTQSTLDEGPFGSDPEAVPDVDPGKIQLTAQNFDAGTIQYKIGESGSFEDLEDTPIVLDSYDMGTDTYIYLKVDPSGDNIINKEGTKVFNGDSYINIDFEQLKAGTFKLDYDSSKPNGQSANLAITKTREIAITLTEASKDMLTGDKLTLIAGHGDRNDVTITSPDLTNTVYVDEGTIDKLVLSFAIINEKYFIPSVTVNGQVYQTTDTGMIDEEGNIIICATLQGAAASVDSFQVDLSIFAQLTCTSTSSTMEIVEGATKYEFMKDGEIVNEGDFALNGADADTDVAVNDALATYDLSLTKDGDATHEITDGIEIHLLLDNTVFTEEEYKVVRNHDGAVEALDTMCEVVHDPSTGEVRGIDVGFTSDKFSSYSIVESDWEYVEATGTDGGATDTGDTIPIIPAVLVAVLGIACATSIYRKRSQN